jgi:hypothetical protein
MTMLQTQPGLEIVQTLYNRHHPAQGSILQLFKIVLSPVNGPMLLLQKPCHPFILALVEDTNIELPHPFGILLQGEFRLFQADWGFTFGPTKV